MAAYLVCLTTDGGIPLFTRTKGNLPQLPFPVIGSLNGVCMFANNQDVSLLNTVTDDAKVIWKVFNERCIIIHFSIQIHISYQTFCCVVLLIVTFYKL